MKTCQNESGFSIVEALLLLATLAIVGFIGYFVYHSQRAANKTLSETNKVGQSIAITKATTATDFATCKQAAGSKPLETYPEQCVTKGGKTFTDIVLSTATNCMAIKEWGAKMCFLDADKTTYSPPESAAGSYGMSDKGQGVGLLLKPEFTSVKDCQALGLGLFRDITPIDGISDVKVLNGYTYFVTGGPAACMNGSSNGNDPVNKLRSKIDSDEIGTGQFTVTALD